MGAPKGTKRLYNAIGNRSGLDYGRLLLQLRQSSPVGRSEICDKEIKYEHRVELASNSPNSPNSTNSTVPRFRSTGTVGDPFHFRTNHRHLTSAVLE